MGSPDQVNGHSPPEEESPSYSEEFEAFWTRYPKGRGSKKDSYAEWRKLKPAERKAAAEALDGWLRCQMWQDPSLVIYCQRWLKARSWENAPPPAARAVRNIPARDNVAEDWQTGAGWRKSDGTVGW